MNLVDSSCWLEYFANTAAADQFQDVIKETSELVVPTIVIYEVFRRALQTKGIQPALRNMAYMHEGLVVDLDTEIALSAAKLGLDLKLPLADSIILAIARLYRATLWTQDAHFEGMPNVKYFPKPQI